MRNLVFFFLGPEGRFFSNRTLAFFLGVRGIDSTIDTSFVGESVRIFFGSPQSSFFSVPLGCTANCSPRLEQIVFELSGLCSFAAFPEFYFCSPFGASRAASGFFIQPALRLSASFCHGGGFVTASKFPRFFSTAGGTLELLPAWLVPVLPTPFTTASRMLRFFR